MHLFPPREELQLEREHNDFENAMKQCRDNKTQRDFPVVNWPRQNQRLRGKVVAWALLGVHKTWGMKSKSNVGNNFFGKKLAQSLNFRTVLEHNFDIINCLLHKSSPRFAVAELYEIRVKTRIHLKQTTYLVGENTYVFTTNSPPPWMPNPQNYETYLLSPVYNFAAGGGIQPFSLL